MKKNTHSALSYTLSYTPWLSTSRFVAACVLFGLTFFAASTAFADSSSSQSFAGSAALVGASEVPPVATDAHGDVTLSSSDDSQLHYVLNAFGIEDATASHLHCAAAGVNGPVIAFLWTSTTTSTNANGLLQEDTLTDADVLPAGATCPTPITNIAELKAAILNGTIYANVHSSTHPIGEIRGQVSGNVSVSDPKNNMPKSHDGYEKKQRDSQDDKNHDSHDREKHKGRDGKDGKDGKDGEDGRNGDSTHRDGNRYSYSGSYDRRDMTLRIRAR